MDTLLKNLYYNVKVSSAFGSVNKLYESAKKINPEISLLEVKDWLKKQKTYTLHKSIKKRFKRNPMYARFIDQWWQSDLADMTKLSKHNKGYKYLLVTIDVLSKFCWVVPVKNKKPDSIIEAFEQIFKENRKPQYLFTDAGTEFLNRKFINFSTTQNFKHIVARNTETKAAVAERVIRTIKEKLAKYMTANKTKTYIIILKDVVKSYNNSIHSRTKYKPISVNKKNEKDVFNNLFKKSTPQKLALKQPGTTVRLQKLKNLFAKGHENNRTNEIFVIDKILNTAPLPRYTVRDKRNEILKGSFYENELQSVIDNET